MAGRVGIQNCGNTCYMNSLIQLLYSIDEFREHVINWENPYRSNCKILDYNKYQIINSNLKEVFKKMKNCKTYYVENTIIFQYLKNIYTICQPNPNRPFKHQEDANEFLTPIIDNIINFNDQTLNLKHLIYHKQYNLIRDRNTKTWRFVINIQKNISYNYIYYPILLLPIDDKINKQNLNLVDLLNDYSKENIMTNNNPTNQYYNKNNDRKIILNGYNKYIIITLSRFKSTYNLLSVQFSKIYTKVIINNILNLDDQNYHLLGAVVHTGAYGGGHYRYLHKENNKYYEFNDASVTTITEYNFKNDLDNNAYILLYKINENLQSLSSSPQNPQSLNNTLQSITKKLETIKKILKK